MNKQKFVDFLRRPHNISDKDLEEIQQTIDAFPYFQSARTVIAKASRVKNLPSAKSEITRASIYATDRGHLKKYIVGDLVFLRPLDVHDSHEGEKKSATDAPKESTEQIPAISSVVEKAQAESKEAQPTESLASPKAKAPVSTDQAQPVVEKPLAQNIEKIVEQKTPKIEFSDSKSAQQESEPIQQESVESSQKAEKEFTVPENPESDLDHLIDDLFADIKEMKENRARLIELEKKIEEEDAVNDAVEKATKKAQLHTEEAKSDKGEDKKESPNSIKETADIDESNIEEPKAVDTTQEEEESKESEKKTVSKPRSKKKLEPEVKETKVDTKTAEESETSTDTTDEVKVDKTAEKASTPLAKPKRPATKKRVSKKAPPKKIDTSTTISSKKVVKGESAMEKAAAKMRASGKIKDNQGPEIIKGESNVNNTPPEKIIKTYIRKRSSERSTKSESKSSDSKESNSDNDDKPGPVASQNNPSEIIEQFIQTQPSITPKKNNAEISLGDLSEQSTSFNPEVASEYLAEIFLEQSKVDKAISIYEQLILKFPDKSTYFADIIKKLKD